MTESQQDIAVARINGEQSFEGGRRVARPAELVVEDGHVEQGGAVRRISLDGLLKRLQRLRPVASFQVEIAEHIVGRENVAVG